MVKAADAKAGRARRQIERVSNTIMTDVELFELYVVFGRRRGGGRVVLSIFPEIAWEARCEVRGRDDVPGPNHTTSALGTGI